MSDIIGELRVLGARLQEDSETRLKTIQEENVDQDIDTVVKNHSLSLSELSRALGLQTNVLKSFVNDAIEKGLIPPVLQAANKRHLFTLEHCHMITDLLHSSGEVKMKKKLWRDEHEGLASIMVASLKGGTGKTQTATSLAVGLSLNVSEAKRVLLVDLDPQGSQRNIMQIDENDELMLTAVDLMLGDKEPDSDYQSLINAGHSHEEIVKASLFDTHIPNLKLLPAHPSDERFNAFAWQEIIDGSKQGGADVTELLKQKVIDVVKDDFDIVIFDSAPSINPLVWSGYESCNFVIVPCATRSLDWSAVKEYLIDLPDKFEQLPSEGKQIKGVHVVATMFEDDKPASDDVLMRMKRHVGDKMFNTTIPKSNAFEVAVSIHRTPLDIRKSEKLVSTRQLDKSTMAINSFVREVKLRLTSHFAKTK
ncbi:ParA family protein [Salinimonas chungwhensis]|uniref:ParA family protein n=1 Tax=Salinimonas chungwhensis TaxID=265425 RepID=UPI00035F8BCA|nr:ParA family protein [Salinimonas chungwhensis]